MKSLELFIIFISVILLIVFLFIFYILVERAVREGINNSVIGRYLEEKHGIVRRYVQGGMMVVWNDSGRNGDLSLVCNPVDQ